MLLTAPATGGAQHRTVPADSPPSTHPTLVHTYPTPAYTPAGMPGSVCSARPGSAAVAGGWPASHLLAAVCTAPAETDPPGPRCGCPRLERTGSCVPAGGAFTSVRVGSVAVWMS
eukprot:366042-Chlamydomonas_euryale.AAC.2